MKILPRSASPFIYDSNIYIHPYVKKLYTVHVELDVILSFYFLLSFIYFRLFFAYNAKKKHFFHIMLIRSNAFVQGFITAGCANAG